MELIQRYDRQLRDALTELWAQLQGRVSLRTIEQLLREGDVTGVLATMADLEPQLAAAMTPIIEQAVMDSGRIAAQLLPAGAASGPLVVSLADPATAAFVRRYVGERIVEISRDTRQAVQDAVLFGVNTGRPPAAVARDFRSSIGLNSQAERAVRNFRQALETNPADALSRQLRDRRYDRTLERDEPLTAKQIDAMTERYRAAQLKHRTQVIARTESMTAISVGQQETIRQGIESGAVRLEREDGKQLRKFWIATDDGRTRHDHRLIPVMNPRGVPVGDNFRSPLGPIKYPREPGRPAAQVIQCRCRVRYRWV